jgi:hypothetical protein
MGAIRRFRIPLGLSVGFDREMELSVDVGSSAVALALGLTVDDVPSVSHSGGIENTALVARMSETLLLPTKRRV